MIGAGKQNRCFVKNSHYRKFGGVSPYPVDPKGMAEHFREHAGA